MSTEAAEATGVVGDEALREAHPSRVLDTRGLVCPYPALQTTQAVAALAPGETLEVLTDNEPTAAKSIPLLCKDRGLRYLVIPEQSHWRILIRKPLS